MSYLNEPLTLAQKRELLKSEGMVLKRDLEELEKDGEFDGVQFKQNEDESEIGQYEIVRQDDYDLTSLRPYNIETLANFLKWKTENDRAYGERSKEVDIRAAIKLLGGLGIKGIE